jgi:hypothetical protein
MVEILIHPGELIFCPTGELEWMNSHAQCPFPLVLPDGLRVYFSTRNAADETGQYVSRTGWAEFDSNFQVKNISQTPALDVGPIGSFDEHGAMGTSVIVRDGRYLMYYGGWSRRASVPYDWAIGLAESSDGLSFSRSFSGPILGASPDQPYLLACPIVQSMESGMSMRHLAGDAWISGGDRAESVYSLRSAHSEDGVHWYRDSTPLVTKLTADECQTGASVWENEVGSHMLFSFRRGSRFRGKFSSSRGYRLGYAQSSDGKVWHRDDGVITVLEPRARFYERSMAYPYVFSWMGEMWVLYCGNDFGTGGFGVSKLEVL